MSVLHYVLPVNHFTPKGGNLSSSKSLQNKSLHKLFWHLHQLHSSSFLCSLDVVNLIFIYLLKATHKNLVNIKNDYLQYALLGEL